MLQNKLLIELYSHLCLKNMCLESEKIIFHICQIIQQNIRIFSPIYLIETAVFNLILPIQYTSMIASNTLRGQFLKQSTTRALILIIKYVKCHRNNQSIAYKLAEVFIQLYKKDHFLYKQKKLYLHKLLNI